MSFVLGTHKEIRVDVELKTFHVEVDGGGRRIEF